MPMVGQPLDPAPTPVGQAGECGSLGKESETVVVVAVDWIVVVTICHASIVLVVVPEESV